MLRRLLIGLLCVISGSALAQGRGPCGGWVTSPWVSQPNYGDPTFILDPRVSVGGEWGGDWGGGGGSSADMGDGKLLLLAVVVVAAAAPLVLYAIDSPSGHDIQMCWEAPSQQFQLYGGGLSGIGGGIGYAGLRGSASFGPIALDVSAEGNPLYYYDAAASFALRAPPKQHVELSLAFGVRQVADVYGRQGWFEISLPHRYLPFRTDAYNPGVGLEVKPAFLFAPNAVDLRLDAALSIPFGPWANLQVGMRAYSFASQIRVGALGGVQLSL